MDVIIRPQKWEKQVMYPISTWKSIVGNTASIRCFEIYSLDAMAWMMHNPEAVAFLWLVRAVK